MMRGCPAREVRGAVPFRGVSSSEMFMSSTICSRWSPVKSQYEDDFGYQSRRSDDRSGRARRRRARERRVVGLGAARRAAARGPPAAARAARGRPARGRARRARGVVADPGTIIVCSGAAQALVLLARALCGPHIAVEDPGLPPHRAILTAHGARLTALPVDAQGALVQELERLRASAGPIDAA